MTEALRKAKQVYFLGEDTGRTMAQAAIKFCLTQGTIMTVLPNITSMEDLEEFAAAPETPDLTEEESRFIDDLWENEFYLEEAAPAAVQES